MYYQGPFSALGQRYCGNAAAFVSGINAIKPHPMRTFLENQKTIHLESVRLYLIIICVDIWKRTCYWRGFLRFGLHISKYQKPIINILKIPMHT